MDPQESYRNPFMIGPRCDPLGDMQPVTGYGDPDADFHVIGNHSGIHGGADTGVPFTGSETGDTVRSVLQTVGILGEITARRHAENLFLNYLYMCPVRSGSSPEPDQYLEQVSIFDAELRAVNAHILIPVGTRATDHVLRAYTTQFQKLSHEMDWRHGRDIRGRGFLVIPMKGPNEWGPNDRKQIVESLREIQESDYRQMKGVATLVG